MAPRFKHLLWVAVFAAGCSSTPPSDTPLTAEPGEELSGGSATVFVAGEQAFAQPVPNLTDNQRKDFFVGNSFFNDNWVAAPASTTGRDGLGPLFNARSCSGCHLHDGRGRPPDDGEPMTSMLIRISLPGANEHGGPVADAAYGDQFQPNGILGVPGEGTVIIQYEEQAGAFADGETYSLRKPTYSFNDLAYGPLDALVSPRVAPAMHGLGLLAAVPEAEILALADPDDGDGDGISGRPNYVWDAEKKSTALGRFGWKANTPHLVQQVAGAFLGDMGITSPLFPNQNCSGSQPECSAALAEYGPEIPIANFDRIAFYCQALAVPARREWRQPRVLAGKQLFYRAGCADCHRPTLTTGDFESLPMISGQTIRPYTDLLLHDMGQDLADGRPDFEAHGKEWRTPPLWGIGLYKAVNHHTYLLHDGRARNTSEAILWHGGEAESARENYRAMSKESRENLIRFLESL